MVGHRSYSQVSWLQIHSMEIHRMSQPGKYVFVFWGDQFEEVPATIFVTELRRVGLRVKVVGLTPQRISGAHGLALLPDLTLDQALPLSTQAVCLIIPQVSGGIQNLKNDPRLQRFFELAHQNQARFVVGSLAGVDVVELKLFPLLVVDNIMVYPEGEDMLGFARELAYLLLED